MVYQNKSAEVDQREVSILMFVLALTTDDRTISQSDILRFYGDDEATREALRFLCGLQLVCRDDGSVCVNKAGMSRIHRETDKEHQRLTPSTDLSVMVAR